MKICFVCGEYPPGPHGGMGTMTRVLARALVRAGHEVRVVGVCSPDYPGRDFEEDDGVRVWRLREKTFRGGWVMARWELYRTVAAWAKRGDVELVEGPDTSGWFAGWPPLPVPVVQRSNGSYSYFAHELGQRVKPMTFRLESWSYRRVVAWAAVSAYTASVTARLFDLRLGPLAILHNPVEVPGEVIPFSRRAPDRVVFAGTLTAKKGILALADAWPGVRRKCPSAELHVFGKDTFSETGQSMRQVMLDRIPTALHPSVSFHGHVGREQLLEALSAARVGVFPSLTEAFALAPLEAMACGCPTISTALGSGPEEIRHGIDGLLVDPRHPDEIENAIVQVLQDELLAERLGNTGRSRVLSSFTVAALLPANEGFYASVMRTFSGQQQP